jgi:hypothetical protein
MLRVPNLEDSESLVDWLEASLLVQDPVARISDAAVFDALQEAGRDAEAVLEQILQQFSNRARGIDARYPFARDGQGFRAAGPWNNHLCYSFLLFASLNQTYNELNYGKGAAHEPAKLFEYLTARALEKFVGGRAIRVGDKREPPVPILFPEAIDYLVAAINEPVGARDLERHDSGDDGLDIWLTKGFDDGRPSQLFLVAQCAIGQDWTKKRSELDLELWKRHVDWYTRPQRAFAVPFQIPVPSWRETATTGGLILDRLRIARLVEAPDLPEPISDRMRAWTAERVAQTVEQVNN